MLDTLRKNSKSAMTYVIFLGIIVVFIFSFGPGSGGCRSGSMSGSDSDIASVNGERIPLADFEQSYGRVYRDYQQRAGGAFTEELAQSIRLKSTVLDQLIDQALLAQAAKAEGIRIGDAELAEAIRKVPAFQVNGAFDFNQYKLIVERQVGSNIPQFEEEMRRSMLAQKMLAAVSESAKVSDDEVRAEFIREKEKYDLAFVRFSPAAVRGEVARPADAQVDAWLKDNAAKAEAHYQANVARYEKPKRVKVRQILVKVDPKADEAAVQAAQKKAEGLREKLAAGADFAALAKTDSDDAASKDKGGELGVLAEGQMDPALQTAAFALKPGEISQPVRTADQGFHVLKVDEVLPAEKKSFKDVEREIAADMLMNDQAQALAKQKAEETLAQVKAGKKLEDLFPAKKKDENANPFAFAVGGAEKPEVDSTGSFSPSGEYVPRIGVDPELSKAVVGLSEQKPVADKVFTINGSQYVVALKTHEKADLKELEQKMDEFRGRARERKSGELVEAYLKDLKAKASIEKNQALLGGEPGGTVLGEQG